MSLLCCRNRRRLGGHSWLDILVLIERDAVDGFWGIEGTDTIPAIFDDSQEVREKLGGRAQS